MSKKQKIFNIVISFIAIIAVSLGGYFYYQLRILKANPQTVAKEESESLISKISRIYLLPTGEDPTVATVSDPEALKSQSFFDQSEKGDKVLIYTKAGKAILYRPSIDKIIDTAPISNNSKPDNTNTAVDSSTPPAPPVTVTPTTKSPSTTTVKTSTKK